MLLYTVYNFSVNTICRSWFYWQYAICKSLKFFLNCLCFRITTHTVYGRRPTSQAHMRTDVISGHYQTVTIYTWYSQLSKSQKKRRSEHLQCLAISAIIIIPFVKRFNSCPLISTVFLNPRLDWSPNNCHSRIFEQTMMRF